jgi:hypothetical protein
VAKRLYAWDVDRDRRFVRIDQPPFDDEGRELLLFNGADIDESIAINLELPRRARARPDFLYAPSLALYVSSRGGEIIKRACVPRIRINRVVLRDAKGAVVDDGYSWLNVGPVIPLLDTERSVYARSASGGIKSVERLVIKEELVPPDDLFLFKELSLPIFSETLVAEIESAGLTGVCFEELSTLTWPG